MRWPLAWSALVVLAASVPLPGAAAAEEPPSLYFTAVESTGPGGDLPACSGNAYALSSEVPEDGKAYHGAATTALACAAYFTYSVAAPLALSGEATAHFFTACDTPVVVATPATVAYRVQLRKNAETVSQVDADGGSGPCTGPDAVTEVRVEGIDTEDTEFAPGDVLTLAVLVWASSAAEGEMASLHYLVGPTRPSRLMAAGLPSGAAAGPAFVAGNLTGEEAAVNATFANATSAVHQYSWATNLTAAQATVNATVANGTVSVRVVDGNGTERVNETYEESANATIPIPEAAPGNWSIVVSYDNFTGNFSLSLGAAPAPVANATASESTTSTGDDNRTGTFPLRKVEKAPGPGVPMLLAATAAAILLVRRRVR